MRSNVVLIDFENVQPDSLQLLESEHFRVLVFVGDSQSTLPFETADEMQKLGARAEYVKIAGNGRNALDFHIAYQIGVLSAREPSANFHIVSRDTGFDPLIRHLKSKKIRAARVKAILDIPIVKAANSKTLKERIQIVVDKLNRPKATKPGTRTTLSNHIASIFHRQLSAEEVAAVVEGLAREGFISFTGTSVIYSANGKTHPSAAVAAPPAGSS